MIATCTRRLEWDSAHRVLRHESKCRSLHGHRYAAEITCKAEVLDPVGRVVDFSVIKEKLGSWIDAHWDHTTLVNKDDLALVDFCNHDAHMKGNKKPYIFVGEPTAENIAASLFLQAKAMIDSEHLWVDHVRVFETPNCWADVS